MDGRGNSTSRRRVAGAPLAVLSGLTLMGGIGGCEQLQPMEVRSTYGPGIKFSGLGSTYDWMPVKKEAEERRVGSPEARVLLRNGIESHLGAKGFEKKQEGSPDFWVHYRIAKKEKQDSSVSPHGEVYEEGSLILDVLDPQTKKIIWRGSARAKINDSDPPDVREKRANEAIRRIMEVFPPKS